eukprot:10838726-Alexandrium_andersonii.AAC.1
MGAKRKGGGGGGEPASLPQRKSARLPAARASSSGDVGADGLDSEYWSGIQAVVSVITDHYKGILTEDAVDRGQADAF